MKITIDLDKSVVDKMQKQIWTLESLMKSMQLFVDHGHDDTMALMNLMIGVSSHWECGLGEAIEELTSELSSAIYDAERTQNHV